MLYGERIHTPILANIFTQGGYSLSMIRVVQSLTLEKSPRYVSLCFNIYFINCHTSI